MAGEIEDRGEAQVHWLVAGQFGLGARGKTLTLNRADFNEALEKRGLKVEASIPDSVGSGDSISVSLAIDSLKVLTLKHVVSAVPELKELAGKADKLASLRDPSVDDVRGILGEGKLFDAARKLLEGDEASDAPKADAGEATGDPDAIFEKAKVQEKTAKSAISMFVKATSSAKKKAKPSARALRDMVEEATWAMARDVLSSPEVQAVEAAWRGVRFLVMQCPKDAQMDVVLLETDPEHMVEDIANRERGEDIDEPECIFVTFEADSTEPLVELADMAEGELIPVSSASRRALRLREPAGDPGRLRRARARAQTRTCRTGRSRIPGRAGCASPRAGSARWPTGWRSSRRARARPLGPASGPASGASRRCSRAPTRAAASRTSSARPAR
ncbi:MAG: type VI secretion system contractile sheath small subunit [Sandaracinaceae bacterium]